jgi:hypothetical protein
VCDATVDATCSNARSIIFFPCFRSFAPESYLCHPFKK